MRRKVRRSYLVDDGGRCYDLMLLPKSGKCQAYLLNQFGAVAQQENGIALLRGLGRDVGKNGSFSIQPPPVGKTTSGALFFSRNDCLTFSITDNW